MKAPVLGQLREQAVKAHQEQDYAQALTFYADYLVLAPKDAVMWSNLGVLHRVQGRVFQALRAHEKAYSFDPENTTVQNNYANILSDLGKYEQSITLRRAILAKDPSASSHISMIGRCLRGLGRYDEAEAHLKKGCAQYPKDAEMELQLSFTQLGNKNYKDGFKSYQSRWRTEHLDARNLSFPEWTGEPLDGKTIVILPEQGFGDAILVSRFISLFKPEGARVVCFVKKPLARLFAHIEGVDEVISNAALLEGMDYWINNIDLAERYFQAQSEVPAPITLHVPDDSQKRAKQIVQPFAPQFKVGVVWNGSVTYKNNAFRSFSHTEFLPLCDVPDVQLFSLYKGPALEAFEQDGSSAFVVNAGKTDRDFADCSALMTEMDLVITSDTVTAHLAGSLGVPVWTLLHWDPFWLWGHEGETTQWYPSMRLFRQDKPLGWTRVLQSVEHALIEEMKSKK